MTGSPPGSTSYISARLLESRCASRGLGVPRDDGDRMQGGMDPGDKPQSPIGGVQADNARANGIEAHGPFQQRTSKWSIMDVGGRKQKEEVQAGAATEHGMHPIAA